MEVAVELQNNGFLSSAFLASVLVFSSSTDMSLQNNDEISSLGQENNDNMEDENKEDEDVTTLVSRFEKHMEEKDALANKSKLERYLLESTVRDEGNFDVLGWWKSNSTRYKIPSSISWDVLAILVSSVASEYAFSTAGRILDTFRSCLAPSTVEALICAQDWLRSPSIPINLQESMDEVEQFEKIDAGITFVED